MNRETFNSYIIDGLIPIFLDEIKYIQNQYPDFEIKSSLYQACLKEIKKNGKISKIKTLNEEKKEKKSYSLALFRELGALYYYYDKHKNKCKDSMNNISVVLDRHKIASVFLCLILEYNPIYIDNVSIDLPEDIAFVNYRIAFRFACYYARISLFYSFQLKLELDEFEHNEYESENTKDTYSNAKKIMKEEHLYPFFPMTRDKMKTYMDHYILILYLQFEGCDMKNIEFPYLLLADTFYLLDVYAKSKLGINVPFQKYGEKGLAHYLSNEISADNDEKDEIDE